MAIQMRRGNNADYDESKMKPGEVAVATDTRQAYVGMGNGDAEELAFKRDLEDLGSDTTDSLKTHPVGSIYMSVNSTSPASLFGGTWEQIKDTFLLSAGDTYAAGSIGGETEHTLTKSEMPSHGHGIYYSNTNGALGFGYNFSNKGTSTSSDPQSSGITLTGGDEPHNNMPPYLAVYIWKRVA